MPIFRTGKEMLNARWWFEYKKLWFKAILVIKKNSAELILYKNNCFRVSTMTSAAN